MQQHSNAAQCACPTIRKIQLTCNGFIKVEICKQNCFSWGSCCWSFGILLSWIVEVNMATIVELLYFSQYKNKSLVTQKSQTFNNLIHLMLISNQSINKSLNRNKIFFISLNFNHFCRVYGNLFILFSSMGFKFFRMYFRVFRKIDETNVFHSGFFLFFKFKSKAVYKSHFSN